MITFDAERGILVGGVDPGLLKAWEQCYPLIDLANEQRKAQLWLVMNPRKRKKNYERFLTNWFARAQQWAEERR